MHQSLTSGAIVTALLMLANGTPSAVLAQEVSGRVEFEGRIFSSDPLPGSGGPEPSNTFGSLAAEPELYYGWNGGYELIQFIPFGRLDARDDARTHVDIRELYWHRIDRVWEIKVGLDRVFWGVTESTHLVDIINQTDQVEGLDGEDKLGQPMIDFTIVPTWGTIDLFVLPYFRERTFPGVDGRLRPPIPLATDHARYTNELEEWYPSLAVRYAHFVGPMDFGISQFHGVSREPRLFVEAIDSTLALVPQYDVINQTGLDVQATLGGWLLKNEIIVRQGWGDTFAAIAAGFEYTFNNVGNTGIDIGILAEYLYDGRPDTKFGDAAIASTAFEDDVFVGSRLAFNDVQDTSFLGGAIVDRLDGSTAIFVEASRRLGTRWTVDLELRSFINTDPTDQLYLLRNDDFLQISVGYYF